MNENKLYIFLCRFSDQNSLARHRKLHDSDQSFQCLECQRTFPSPALLRRHLSLHYPQNRAPIPCMYCGRRFMTKADLANHEESHLSNDRVHICDICNKSFSDLTELNLHKKYHEPDRKFDCEVCGREFSRLNNLQRHMLVHQQVILKNMKIIFKLILFFFSYFLFFIFQKGASEEILACDICGITYKFMSSLTRHMVTTHMNPDKLRQQADEQRKKRETNYRRYIENRKMYDTTVQPKRMITRYLADEEQGSDAEDDDLV